MNGTPFLTHSTQTPSINLTNLYLKEHRQSIHSRDKMAIPVNYRRWSEQVTYKRYLTAESNHPPARTLVVNCGIIERLPSTAFHHHPPTITRHSQFGQLPQSRLTHRGFSTSQRWSLVGTRTGRALAFRADGPIGQHTIPHLIGRYHFGRLITLGDKSSTADKAY